MNVLFNVKIDYIFICSISPRPNDNTKEQYFFCPSVSYRTRISQIFLYIIQSHPKKCAAK